MVEAILFDLGGTFLRSGVLCQDGSITSFEKVRIENVTHGLLPDEVWKRILRQVISYQNRVGRVDLNQAPMVFSLPGAVVERKRLLEASTVIGSGLVDLDLAAELESSTGRRSIFLNDVSAAAWRIAELTTAERFFVVTVSSGIGGKLFDRLHPLSVLDRPVFAGEIGHIVVDDSPAALTCDCGGRGHLGGISSGRGLERIAKREALANPEAFNQSALVLEFNASLESMNNEEHLVPAILAGDVWARSLLSACTRPLVRSLLTMAMGAGLDRVFIMGGLPNALGDTYISMVRALANELCDFPAGGVNVAGLFEPINREVSLEGCAAYFRQKGSHF